MTRSDLIRKLHKKNPQLLQADVEKIVDVFFEEISNALVKGQRVEFRRFGSFMTRDRKPRIARNPSTGDKVSIGAKRAPYFRMGKAIKEHLNK